MPLEPLPTITTSRTTIRELRESDLADLMAVNGDPEVTAFLPYANWQSLEDARDWLERMRREVAIGMTRQLVIVHNGDDTVIGTTLLFRYHGPSARAELGYVLGRSYWGQGLATEAISALLTHAFEHMSIRRIEAEVNPANEASNALLRSLGFTHEGLLRERWMSNGEAYGVNVYGLLDREWRGGP